MNRKKDVNAKVYQVFIGVIKRLQSGKRRQFKEDNINEYLNLDRKKKKNKT